MKSSSLSAQTLWFFASDRRAFTKSEPGSNSSYIRFLAGFNDRLPPGCASLFALFGVLLTIVGFFLFSNTFVLITHGITVQGIITSYQVATNCRGGDDYHIRFVTTIGQEIELDKTASSCSNTYHVGEAVSMLYDPADPQQAEPNTLNDLWLMPAGIVALGLVFSVFFGGIAWLRHSEKRQRKKESYPQNHDEGMTQLEIHEENVLEDQVNTHLLLDETNGGSIIVYPQKKKLFLAIALCGLFVAVGIWMVLSQPMEGIVLGVITLLFCGLGSLLLMYRLLAHVPLLVINEDGVSMASFGGLFMRWEEIAFMNMNNDGYAFCVYAFINSENRQTILSHQSRIAGFLFKCFRSFYPHYQDLYKVIDLSSPLVTLPIPGRQLVHHIRRMYQQQLEQYQVEIKTIEE